MCLLIPSKATQNNQENNTATVDTMWVSREASLDLMEEGSVQIGDFVLLHIGFIMNKIDEEDTMASLETYREILELMNTHERQQAILDGDNCANRGWR